MGNVTTDIVYRLGLSAPWSAPFNLPVPCAVLLLTLWAVPARSRHRPALRTPFACRLSLQGNPGDSSFTSSRGGGSGPEKFLNCT